MPMKTTFRIVVMLFACNSCNSNKRDERSKHNGALQEGKLQQERACSIISPDVRFPRMPIVPVEQNRHAIRHPTCDDTHNDALFW
jgi:hypothetical protein